MCTPDSSFKDEQLYSEKLNGGGGSVLLCWRERYTIHVPGEGMSLCGS